MKGKGIWFKSALSGFKRKGFVEQKRVQHWEKEKSLKNNFWFFCEIDFGTSNFKKNYGIFLITYKLKRQK